MSELASDISNFLPSEWRPITKQEDLVQKILLLLRSDLPRLYNILYTIDIDEERLRKAFENDTDENIAHKISKLVIDRLLQKLETRKKYS